MKMMVKSYEIIELLLIIKTRFNVDAVTLFFWIIFSIAYSAVLLRGSIIAVGCLLDVSVSRDVFLKTVSQLWPRVLGPWDVKSDYQLQ